MSKSSPILRSAFVPHDLTAPITGAAQGPLAGLTAAVKDMYDIEGYRTGGGNPEWLATHEPAKTNCPAVTKILQAGATVIGKTVCDEFFFSVTGVNAHYGTPVNPRGVGRMPGGSSSGSASATASGACDFALGSDTGGSVRVPAAFCGLYGLRPTHGRVDLSGAMPMSPSFDVAGWFACAPGLFRRIGGVLLEGASDLSPIKDVIILDDAFAQADADVAALLQSSLNAMMDELPRPTHAKIAPDGFDVWREAFRVFQGREIWNIYGGFVTTQKPKLGPGIRERLEFASRVSERDAEAARAVKARASAHIRAIAKPGTVLALPTAPCIAPRIDLPAEQLESFRVRVMRLTCISGMSGLPQMTIPIGTVSGCPVGLSFVGWAGGDEPLLELAQKLSRFCGGYLPVT
ncbi:MAG: amidase [Rhizobiales bacterium]|nr:amidase [Hyphomicrobiales bacterium]